MTSSIGGFGAEPGTSPALHRWLDVLRAAGPAGTARLAHPAGTGRVDGAAAQTSEASGASAARRGASSAPGAGARATDLAHLLRASGAASRLAPAALGAHAAVGELDARRSAFAGVERILADSARALRAPVGALQAMVQPAGEGGAQTAASDTPAGSGVPTGSGSATGAGTSAGSAGSVESGAGATRSAHRASATADTAASASARTEAQREVAARTAVTAREGAGALARAADRLDTLRLEAEAAVRATAAQVNALSQEVASADRRARMDARAQERLDSERAGTREAQIRREEAETRRDTAARELVRLTGATVHGPSTSAGSSASTSSTSTAATAVSSPSSHSSSAPSSTLPQSGAPVAGESSEAPAMRIMLGDRALVDEHGAHPLVVRASSEPDAGSAAPDGRSAPGAQESSSSAPRARGDVAETGPIDRRALQAAAARLAQAELDDGDPRARSARERRVADRDAQERIEDRRAVRDDVDGSPREGVAATRDEAPSTRETSRASAPETDDAASSSEQAERLERLRRRGRDELATDADEDTRHASGEADRLVRKALARIDAEQAAAAVADLRDVQRAQDDADRAAQEADDARAARPRPSALRVTWDDGSNVEATAGVLAGRLAAAGRIIPDAQDRVQSAARAFVAAVDALTGHRALPQEAGGAHGVDALAIVAGLDADAFIGGLGGGSAAGGAAAGGATAGRAGDPDRTVTGSGRADRSDAVRQPETAPTAPQTPADAAARTVAGLDTALRGVETARADAGEQAVLAQRRLDVLSVVDSVLADAPTSQAGGLVSAALGGGAAPTGVWQTSQSGQHLVSSLQSLNALTASLGAVAGLSAVVGPTAPTVTVQGAPGATGLVATPSASALGGASTGGLPTTSQLPMAPTPTTGSGLPGELVAGTAGGPPGSTGSPGGLGAAVRGPAGSGADALGTGLGGPAAGDQGGDGQARSVDGLWTSGPGVRVSLLAPPSIEAPVDGSAGSSGSTAGGATGGPAAGEVAAPIAGVPTGNLGPGSGPTVGTAPDAGAQAGIGLPVNGIGPDAGAVASGGGAPSGAVPLSPPPLGSPATPGQADVTGLGAGSPDALPSNAAAPGATSQDGGIPLAGATWEGPRIPYDVEVSVVSVAAAAAVATAALPTGAVLNAGRGFSFALVTHAGTPGEATTSVSVGPGARLGTVAAAINASAAPVFAQVEGVGAGSPPSEQRLLISATETGADTGIALVDGFGSRRPSALGGVAQVQAGADSVVHARFADGAVVGVTGATSSLPGALPGVDLALRHGSGEGSPSGPTGVGGVSHVAVRADTPAALRQLTTLVDAATTVLDGLAGRGPIDPAAAGVLAQDPAIADLSTRIAAALVGTAGAASAGGSTTLAGAVTGAVSGASAGGALETGDRREALPGVRLDRQARLHVDAEAFELAHADDPYAVESQVHRAARELLSVAREASDPRTGVLPVRIIGVSAFVQEYAVTQANVDERMQYRQEALTDRVEAMQSLLDHLGAERQWLSTQV